MLLDAPILGSVGVGLCKYLSIITNNLPTKPTLTTSIKQPWGLGYECETQHRLESQHDSHKSSY